MSLSGDSLVMIDDEVPQWDLVPVPSRVDALDSDLRLRLATSLDYLGEFASLDPDRRAALLDVKARLIAAPVSPWVFCLYSKLVAELSKTPPGDAAWLVDALQRAASFSVADGVVPLRNASAPDSWWDHFQVLLDTDRQRPFRPAAPDAESFSLCEQEIAGAFDIMRRGDPALHSEVQHLLRMIVLGVPASPASADGFNGASTFFLWGAALLNARIRRSALATIDLLVHESSHVLLFGLSAAGPLLRNDGTERYASPLRTDARPLDGIFHACFVSTRVHLAMERLLASGMLSAEEAGQAVERRRYNGDAAKTSLELLELHAKTTETGKEVLGAIRAYWANSAAG